MQMKELSDTLYDLTLNAVTKWILQTA